MFSMCLWDNLEVGFLPSRTQKELKSVPSPNLLSFQWTLLQKPQETVAFHRHQTSRQRKSGRFRELSGMKRNLVHFHILLGIHWGSLMDGASILKLFKLFIILTLVLKQKNNAKINGFLKLLMWVGCIQIPLKLRKSLIEGTGNLYTQLWLDCNWFFLLSCLFYFP